MLLRAIKSIFSLSGSRDRQQLKQDALAALRRGEHALCADKLESLLRMGVIDNTVFFNVAQCYTYMGQYQKAMAAYQAVLEHLPEHIPSLGGLGWLLHVTGESEAALTLYQKCAALEKADLEPWFEETYLKGLIKTSTCPFPMRRRQRRANLLQIFNNIRHLRGEVAECGCFQGLSSFLLCSALARWEQDFLGEQFHIFDSFEGLSRPGEQDAEPVGRSTPMCKEGFFGASLELVRNNLADFPKINYHPGWIPDSFVGLPELSYRFVHVDVDLYTPTLASFQYFFPRLVPGGIILTDDYNWPGARQAVEEFASEAGVGYQLTANDQAYFIRPQ